MNPVRRSGIRAAAVLALLALLGAAPRAAAEEVVVFAAASLKNALDDAAAVFAQHGGEKVAVSYAASSALAKQIESGAPADIFISADLDWMDWAQQRHLIKAETRETLLGNALVLVEAADANVAFKIAPGAESAGVVVITDDERRSREGEGLPLR